jgi:V/A-type H+-transporting ATPase subunit K
MTPEWIEFGRGLAYGGAACSFGLAGIGSAWGIAIASHAAAGVMREKPELIAAILLMVQTGLIGGSSLKISFSNGLALLIVGILNGLAQLVTAKYQGEASAAGISLVGRRPDAAGKAVLFPAFVETYAVLSLLGTILSIIFLTQPIMLQFLSK